ncbi:hypothetical protein CELL_01870 [Cellulomonas sp. T2.31MG-18]|uniref:DUF2202 domain-containing protein n=1 Tax=Cellulomonas sp. T2.31MG-18 TaxID=3157619 RepID=UPI0035EC4656
MRTRTRLTIAATTGVVATALIAAPSLAAARGDAPAPSPSAGSTAGPGTGVCDGTGAGMRARGGQGTPGAGSGLGAANGYGNGAGRGAGQGMGQGMRQGPGQGTGTGLTGVESGTLTDAQKAQLAAMAEEELLAHDLYTAFAADATTPVFEHVADAESQHLIQIRILLERYGVADPSADHTTGRFSATDVQATYDRLLAEGSASTDAAYAAARSVEQADITDLTDAKASVTAPDVQLVYSHLLTASERHLAAFGG